MDHLELSGAVRDRMELSGAVRDRMELSGAVRDRMELSGAVRGRMEGLGPWGAEWKVWSREQQCGSSSVFMELCVGPCAGGQVCWTLCWRPGVLDRVLAARCVGPCAGGQVCWTLCWRPGVLDRVLAARCVGPCAGGQVCWTVCWRSGVLDRVLAAVAADCGGQGAYVGAPSQGFRGSRGSFCPFGQKGHFALFDHRNF